MKKYLSFLGAWLDKDPKYGKVICLQKSFLPNKNNMNSQGMSTGTIFGLYCSLNIFDTDFEDVRKFLGGVSMVCL